MFVAEYVPLPFETKKSPSVLEPIDTNCLEAFETKNELAVKPLNIKSFEIVTVVPLSEIIESVITPSAENLVIFPAVSVPLPRITLASESFAPAFQ